MQGASSTSVLLIFPSILFFFAPMPNMVNGDCWLIEGDKGYVWLAICSQNQPPYETIPQHINNTVHDLRLNENKLKAVLFSSMYRFTNLTDLNLTKNDINYIEDGAFAGQANLQVRVECAHIFIYVCTYICVYIYTVYICVYLCVYSMFVYRYVYVYTCVLFGLFNSFDVYWCIT